MTALERASIETRRNWEHNAAKLDPSDAWQDLANDIQQAALAEATIVVQRVALQTHMQKRAEVLNKRKMPGSLATQEDRLHLRRLEKDTKQLNHQLDLEHVDHYSGRLNDIKVPMITTVHGA
ncbi:unnamed protein product [Prorocentrum cordatum]|uniref:Uncharacterized protein n=1 Tax=Prorocentrum cordatum TaxID=2364126 RepID=A0ABN9PNH2_9DINO|nr:unnamed protein product [Polarella glacialis]